MEPIARILAREFWSRGEAPTFAEYAAAWLQAVSEHSQPNPERAFLGDRARGTSGPDWKSLRAKRAARVLHKLKKICVGGSAGIAAETEGAGFGALGCFESRRFRPFLGGAESVEPVLPVILTVWPAG